MALQDIGTPVECVFANDGVQAIEILSNGFLPNYIFLDMNMPRMNGTQCLEEIRKMQRLHHIPVYMYSTSADTKSVSETLALGATDFLVKPNNIGALTAQLVQLFNKNPDRDGRKG